MLDRMETNGLIKRVPDKKNRRQTFILITEKAKVYREKYDELSEQMNAVFYAGFDDDEIRDFEDKLRRIINNLEE